MRHERVDDDEQAIDLDTLFTIPDVPPSEPEPPFEEALEHAYLVDGSDRPVVDVEERDGGWKVTIKARSDVTPVHPPVKGGRYLDPGELSKYADGGRHLVGHRPPWLAAVSTPRTRMHRLRLPPVVNLPVRPLVGESQVTSWPWSAIGKLFVMRRGKGTQEGSGVLVGPNLLLTASHAMPWEVDDYYNYSIRFAPNYRYGNDKRFGHAFVDHWRGVRNRDSVTGLDYVICQLSWRIGDRTGWLGSQSFGNESSYFQRDKWFSVGYPGSFENGQLPAMEVPVNVVDLDNEADGLEIETHLFATGGWSGGPLWGFFGQDARVIGIESGLEKDGLDPTRTVFAGGSHMVNLVKYGYAHWV